ncbi:MAG: hypothetical protein AAF206_20830, partial [Bacteroidota bacterium]
HKPLIEKTLDTNTINQMLKTPDQDMMLQDLTFDRVDSNEIVFVINYGDVTNKIFGGDFFFLFELSMNQEGQLKLLDETE